MDQSSESPVLRVGLVGPIPPPNGGMAMQTAQLRRLLEGEGISIDFLATNSPYRPRWLGRIPVLRAVARLIPYLWGVFRLAGRSKVIHVMANSGWSWHLFTAPVLLLAPLRGARVIVNYRGGEARVFFDRSFRWVRHGLARASRIIVPSAYLQQVFGDFGETAEVIPNIIDRSLFHPTERENADNVPFRFVITRNLEKIYAIDTALRAFAYLGDRGRGAVLEIAGSGPEKEALSKLCTDLDIAPRVRFLGRLDRDEIRALYGRAGAMLNPTTVDNMPNSILEALACGVPVISTDVGGVPYIVEHDSTALLVPVGDADTMAAAMDRVITDDALRERLRERGLARVVDYEWSTVGPRWVSLYRELSAA